MIPNYVQIDMVIVSINTGNHTISLNKHTIVLEIYNSTRQYMFRPMCIRSSFNGRSHNSLRFLLEFFSYPNLRIRTMHKGLNEY